jgi:hypothetical protein
MPLTIRGLDPPRKGRSMRAVATACSRLRTILRDPPRHRIRSRSRSSSDRPDQACPVCASSCQVSTRQISTSIAAEQAFVLSSNTRPSCIVLPSLLNSSLFRPSHLTLASTAAQTSFSTVRATSATGLRRSSPDRWPPVLSRRTGTCRTGAAGFSQGGRRQ